MTLEQLSLSLHLSFPNFLVLLSDIEIANNMATQTSTSLRAQYAKHILERHVLRKFNAHHDQPADNAELPERPPADGIADGPAGRVCIVGAGTAGLQVALLLLHCGFNDFDILEASDRVGGRAYTYNFAPDPTCPHNYYDAGAMRIPEIDAMKR